MHTINDIYEIQPGDTLAKIAAKFGVSLPDLLLANQQIQNPNLTKVGQKINIPGTAPAAPPTPAPGHPTAYDGIHPAPGTISMNRENYSNPPLTNSPG